MLRLMTRHRCFNVPQAPRSITIASTPLSSSGGLTVKRTVIHIKCLLIFDNGQLRTKDMSRWPGVNKDNSQCHQYYVLAGCCILWTLLLRVRT